MIRIHKRRQSLDLRTYVIEINTFSDAEFVGLLEGGGDDAAEEVHVEHRVHLRRGALVRHRRHHIDVETN